MAKPPLGHQAEGAAMLNPMEMAARGGHVVAAPLDELLSTSKSLPINNKDNKGGLHPFQRIVGMGK